MDDDGTVGQGLGEGLEEGGQRRRRRRKWQRALSLAKERQHAVNRPETHEMTSETRALMWQGDRTLTGGQGRGQGAGEEMRPSRSVFGGGGGGGIGLAFRGMHAHRL